MEICTRRSHIHSLGVLWYSTVESVILFRSLEDVNCLHHALLDMIELCNEAIHNSDNGTDGGTCCYIHCNVAF